MESLIFSEVVSWKYLVYAGIFVGMLVEGEVVALMAFFLVYQGYIGLYQTIFFILTGVWIGDFLWYMTGPYLEKIRLIQKVYNKFSLPMDKQMKKRPYVTMILSKFIFGVHRLALLRARLSGVTAADFLKIDLVASIVWILTIGVLSVFFSASLVLLKKYLRFIEYGLLLAVVIFTVFARLVSKYLRTNFGGIINGSNGSKDSHSAL